MLLVPATALSDGILAVHILAVVIAFGVIFAYPLLFAAASRMDPSVTPWLLRSRQRIGRRLVNPGLIVVLLAGIYLAGHRHQLGSFYVQWGFAAVIAIGAIEAAVVSRRAGRLAELSQHDLAAADVAAGGQRMTAQWSPEYLAGFRQLTIAGVVIQAIVVITVVLMTTHAGA